MWNEVRNNKWEDEVGNNIWKDDFGSYIVSFSNDRGQEIASSLEKAKSIVKNMRK